MAILTTTLAAPYMAAAASPPQTLSVSLVERGPPGSGDFTLTIRNASREAICVDSSYLMQGHFSARKGRVRVPLVRTFVGRPALTCQSIAGGEVEVANYDRSVILGPRTAVGTTVCYTLEWPSPDDRHQSHARACAVIGGRDAPHPR
jgi:hypothetical protein